MSAHDSEPTAAAAPSSHRHSKKDPSRKDKTKSKDKHPKDAHAKERKRKRHAASPPAESSAAAAAAKKPRPARGSDPNCAYRLVTASLYLALAPKYSFFPEQAGAQQLLAQSAERAAHLRALTPLHGVRKHHLDPLLTRYFEPVGGVVVAYDHVRFDAPAARIIAESPFAHIGVTVDFLVWRPRRGMVLRGWVNLQSPSHIGLLVENTWNVSIPLAKIPPTWAYRDVREGFVSKHPRPGIGGAADLEDLEGEKVDPADEGGWADEAGEYVDGLLSFQVESVKAGGSIFVMEGSLLDQDAIRKAELSSRKEAA